MVDETPPVDNSAEESHLDQSSAPSAESQVLGEAAVEQQATGPETPPTSERMYVGVDHSINPDTGEKRPREEEPSTRIQDEDLAHDMAEVRSDTRSRAASIRRGVAAERTFKTTLHGIVNDPKYRDESNLHTFKAAFGRKGSPRYAWDRELPHTVTEWGADQLEQLEARAAAERRSPHISGVDWKDRFDPREGSLLGAYDPTKPFRVGDLGRARVLDKAAERDEEWVRRLHEHPVNDEYRAAHPDIGFGPTEMRALEDVVELHGGKDIGEVRLDEGKFEDPDSRNFESVIKALEEALDRFEELATEQDEQELGEEYDRVMSDGDTTLNDLVAFNEKVRQRNNARLDDRIEERTRVLEDVRSGRAGQPPEPPELAQAS